MSAGESPGMSIFEGQSCMPSGEIITSVNDVKPIEEVKVEVAVHVY